MQASKHTVDEVLEAIADCILQCVMFQAEAEETGARLKTMETDGLVASMNFLSDLATRKAAMWADHDEAMSKEMLEATQELRQCCQSIARDIQTIADNPISKDAKKSLLRSAKVLMQKTVFLLQVADLYDIRQIIHLARDCKERNEELVTCLSVQDFPEVVRKYIFQTVSLAKIVQVRVDYIVDPILKKKLAKPNEVISTLPEQEIELTAAIIQGAGMQQDIERRDEMHDNVNYAIDEIILVTKETSHTLFAGLDLDIPLDDEDEDDLPPSMLGSAAMASILVNAENALAALADAVAAGDRSAAAVACQQVKEAIDNLIAADNNPNLRSAAERLAQALRDLLGSTKAAVTNPEDAAAMRNFNNALAALKEAAARYADLSASAVVDPITEDAQAVHAALEDLRKAVDAGNAAAAAKANQAVAAAVTKLSADLPEADRQRLQAELAKLAQQIQGLAAVTQATLSDPHNQAKAATFTAAVATIGDLTNAIVAGVRPPDGEMSADDRLRLASAKVANALAGLFAATNQKDVQKVADAVKAVNAAVAQQTALAKAIAAGDKRPGVQNSLMDAAAKLARAMQDLVASTKAVMANPNDPEARKQFEKAMRDLQQACVEASGVLMPLEDQLLDANAEMLRALAKLTEAQQKRDRNGAEAALEEATDAIKRQMVHIKAIAGGITDPRRKNDLIGAAKRMAEALNALKGALPAILASPNDRNAQAAYNKALEDLKAAGLDLADNAISSDPEEAIIVNASRINDLTGMINDALKSNRKDDAAAAAYVAERAIEKQAILAKLAARKQVDNRLRDSLLGASRQLADALAGLCASTKAASAGNTQARQAVQNQIAELDQLNQQLVDSLVDANDCEDKIKELAEEISKTVKSIGPTISIASYPELVRVADKLAQEIQLAHSYSRNCNDAEKQQQIERAANKGEQVLRELRAAAANLLRNPNDKKVQDTVSKSLQDAKQAGKLISQAVGTTAEKKLMANGLALNRDIDQLEKLLSQGQTAAADNKLDKVEKRIDIQIAKAGQAANNTDHPELKKLLQEGADELKKLKPQLVASANKAIKEPTNRAAQSEFSRSAQQVKAANNKLMGAAKRVDAKEIPRNKVELSQVTTVGGAADAIDSVTSNLPIDTSTPLGRLYAASRTVGDEMRKLSEAGARKDKRAMIAAARVIASAVADIEVNAGQLAKDCRDTQTRDYLMSMAYAAKNFGVQMKILAAVKTSSVENDPTTEGQLVTCGRGLANAVIECINNAEIASLKAK